MAGEDHKRQVICFKVGSGNSALVSLADDQNVLIDLNETDDGFGVLDYLKKRLPKRDKKPFLSVLCVTHAHDDHIKGAKRLLKEFLVGEIWYPNYDRFRRDDDDPPEDYKVLHDEIDRRRKTDSDEVGEIEHNLTAKDNRGDFCGEKPKDFEVRVLSPWRKDEDDPKKDIHDMSLVLNLGVSSNRWLFPGDSEATVWVERIIPLLLKKKGYKDWGYAEVLLAAHHGSHTFFDEDRDQCLKEPKNKEALDYVTPDYLVVSSAEKFPLKDQKREQPPHYAAYKWYKKHFVDRGKADEDERHPDVFLYTCEGNICFELDGSTWVINSGWEPDSDPDNGPDSGPDKEGAKLAPLVGGFTPRTRPSRPKPRTFGS